MFSFLGHKLKLKYWQKTLIQFYSSNTDQAVSGHLSYNAMSIQPKPLDHMFFLFDFSCFSRKCSSLISLFGRVIYTIVNNEIYYNYPLFIISTVNTGS